MHGNMRSVSITSSLAILALRGCGTNPESLVRPSEYQDFAWSLFASGEKIIDVSGTASDNVVALDGRGTLLHYNGVEWRVNQAPAVGAIGASPAGDVFVASGAMIHQYDGVEWKIAYAGAEDRLLMDIWVASNDCIYAVGQAGTIVHYDGIAWNTVATSANWELHSVWGNSSADVYAGGPEGILHFDGIAWTRIADGVGKRMWGSSPTNIFAIQGNGVYQYQGAEWKHVAEGRDARDIWGSSGTDIYVVGRRGAVLHYDGVAWTEQSAGDNDLTAVWGSSAADIYMVGGGYNWESRHGSLIRHFDGVAWREATHVLQSKWMDGVAGVDGTWSDDVFFVGQYDVSYPTVVHFNGSTLQRYRYGDDVQQGLKGVSVAEPGTAFVVAERGVARFVRGANGSWRWWETPFVHFKNYARSVWAASPTRAFLVVKDGFYRFDGSEWTSMLVVEDEGSWDIDKIWGASETDVFAVGGNGTAYHYDGSSWTRMSTGTTEQLRRVWGTSGKNVYAVGDNGTIIRYDGSRWVRVECPTFNHLYGVWGSSPSDIFVSGQGIVLHFDGISWSITSDSFGGSDVWGSSGDDVYVVDGRRIWRYGPESP